MEKLYTLKAEKEHQYFDGVEFHKVKPGETIPLTTAQASAWSDKFSEAPAGAKTSYPVKTPPVKVPPADVKKDDDKK